MTMAKNCVWGDLTHLSSKGIKVSGETFGGHSIYDPKPSIRPSNSIAFGKSTSQRIYPKQHTPKIG